MDQIRWIIMSSFLMLLVQFTVVAWKYSSSTVRVGDEVTLSCLKKVTYEDAARYICRQFRSGQLHGEGTVVYLSVVTMTEQKNDDTVTLFCSVLTYGGCVHTVKWLYEGDKTDVKTTQLDCSGTVTFTTSHLHQKSEYYELLKCEVTHHQDVQLFTFIPSQSSSEKPGWWRIIVVSLGLASLITSVVVVNIWARAKVAV
ncbi:uncharacterized protein LOC114573440 isoform X4 [Perca flavescens]|uniref:uncharacterized protein LOC114573440 isoform X4 n=1 Tax=Perca flavescens TaxID=8167 RepID=UPI00106EBF81|nr:uncharacterized protein LOC114573440 isoform X4 [Perca flavescens]